MVDNTVWSQELSWVCPVCGFKIPDSEMHITWRDDEREYDIAVCPSCGTESIIPREYW